MTAGAGAEAAGKLRVLVLEDEWVARDFLVELVEASGLATVIGAVASFEEAKELLEAATGIDVVFVDIHLAGSDHSGLSLVRGWAARDGAPLFVLATAMREHALEAFDLGVADYVTKPFSAERIQRCLARLVEKRAPRPGPLLPGRIVARRRSSLVFLELDDVWAFESSDRLTYVHARHGVYDVDLSLAAVELSFGRKFVRTHRNWLVNADHIRELERDAGESTVLVGAYDGAASGLRVPVARHRAQALRDELLASARGIRRR